MTYRVNLPLPAAAALRPEGSCGPAGSGWRTYRSFGAAGGKAAFTLNQMRKLPAVQPVSSELAASRNGEQIQPQGSTCMPRTVFVFQAPGTEQRRGATSELEGKMCEC